MSKKIDTAAVSVINVAATGTGRTIKAFAAYLDTATASKMTVNESIDHLLALDTRAILRGKSTLGLYSQTIKTADKLALSDTDGYAAVYGMLSRVRRVAGYDLRATVDKIAALPVAERADAVDSVTAETVEMKAGKTRPAPKTAATHKDGAQDTTAEDSVQSAGEDILDLLKSALKIAKSATLTSAEAEAVEAQIYGLTDALGL